MVEGIKNIRAYRSDNKEVDRIDCADVLFIDTTEAAQALYQKDEHGKLNFYSKNDDYPFDENNPGVYILDPDNDCWYEIESYIQDIQDKYDYCKFLKTFINLKKKGD